MIKRIALILPALILSVLMGIAIGHNMDTPVTNAGTNSADVVIPPCETEDSTNCVWYANEQGNGKGVSFVDVEGDTFIKQ